MSLLKNEAWENAMIKFLFLNSLEEAKQDLPTITRPDHNIIDETNNYNHITIGPVDNINLLDRYKTK